MAQTDGGEPVRKIYCDTDTLLNNIKRHEHEPKSQEELAALERLVGGRGSSYSMYRSHVALAELEQTTDREHREKLRGDYEALERIPQDEKLIGFHNQMDRLGTVSVSPVMSDVQDEALCQELGKRGLTLRDAQQLTQAISNNCDIFLTRDEKIIRHREWLMATFPGIKLKRPSEAVSELGLPAAEDSGSGA